MQPAEPRATSDATVVSGAVRDIADGAGIAFIGKFTGLLLRYLAQLFIAWFYGAATFGLYALGMAVYQLADPVLSLGLQSGAVRYVSMYRGSDVPRLKGVLLDAIRVPFAAGSVFGLLLFAASDALAVSLFRNPEVGPVLKAFSFALPFSASMSAAALATTGFRTARYAVYAIHWIYPSVNLAACMLFAGLGLGLVGMVGGVIAASVTGWICALVFVCKLFPGLVSPAQPAVHQTRALLRFSAPLATESTLWVIVLWTDVLILGFFRAPDEVGIYRGASQLALLLSLGFGSLDMIFAPVIAELQSIERRPELGELYRTATRWMLSATLPLFVLLTLAGEGPLRMFGAEFAAAALPLAILSLGQLANAAAGSASQMLIMSGHPLRKLVSDALLATLVLGLNLLLIPRWGLPGAAIATASSMTLTSAFRLWQVHRVLAIQPYDRKYGKALLAAAVCAGAGLLARDALHSVHFAIAFAATAAVVGAVYVVVLWLLGIEEVDRTVLEQFAGKLRRSTGP